MSEITGASKILPQRPDVAAIRQSKGITLDRISETTKISKRFLKAIEDGDFGQLPGGIFNTSYIRQYAREIDIDEADLLKYYYSRTGESPSDEERAREVKKKPVSRAMRFLAIARF